MKFIEERLLDCISYSSSFGIEFNTKIEQIVSGQERRVALWDMPRGKFTVDYSMLTPEHGAILRGAFMACRGSLYGFRFKDWADFKVSKSSLGITKEGSNTIQLTKSYSFGGEGLKRIIRKPVTGTVKLYINEIEESFTIDYSTGIISFNAEAGGLPIAWSGEFDTPVRFLHDKMDFLPGVTKKSGLFVATGAELIEVRL